MTGSLSISKSSDVSSLAYLMDVKVRLEVARF